MRAIWASMAPSHLEMHAPESDIDFVVYGTDNFRVVEDATQRLVNENKLTYIAGNRIEAARKFVGKYQGKIWMYNATKKPEEIKSKFGDYTYTPLAPVRFAATVCDDTETMYRPAIYKISNYQPHDDQSELDIDKIPIQVVSNIGCYRNVARAGQQIKVAGTLEKAQSTKDGISLLPSRCWNSHFGRRIHMATLNLRDRDAIQTAEGIIFRVFGYSHPPRRLSLRCRIRQLKNL